MREALYIHTLRILRWGGNYSFGIRINNRKQVGNECGRSMGENGDGWKTLSIITWWFCLKESFIPHVLVSPFGICVISMGRNAEEMNPRRKLRIGMTGNVGGGAPSINYLVETIE